jgi:alternate signal-mediated exported protein
MKRPVKAVVATSLGMALLLGGSTYALWSSNDVASTEAEILTGESQIEALDSGTWTDWTANNKDGSPEKPIEDINSFRLAPSDYIAYSQEFNVKYTGSPDSLNRMQLTFDDDSAIDTQALAEKRIYIRSTLIDYSTGRISESSTYDSKNLDTGYDFTGSLPASGSNVRVMVHVKFDDAGEANDETTKKLQSIISSAKLSASAATQAD